MADYTKTLAFQLLQKFESYRAEIEKYACIGQHCPIPCYITAHDGDTVLYVNPAFITLTGCNVADMTSNNWHRLFLPEDFESVMTNWRKFIETKRPFRIRQRWLHVKTGAISDVYNYVSMVDGNGFVGFLVPVDANAQTTKWYPHLELHQEPAA